MIYVAFYMIVLSLSFLTSDIWKTDHVIRNL